MNKHFEDSRYYIGRAVESAASGIRAEFEPAETRIRSAIGREAEPEPSRIDVASERLTEFEERSTGRVRGAFGRVRGRLPSRGSAQ